MFQLTSDLSSLIWYSSSNDQARVQTKDIDDVRPGQSSSVFQKYPIPMLQHLSFSIYYNDRTLDLTCKDEIEYDFWVTALKALAYSAKGFTISKQYLLSHSKRFNKYLAENRISGATTGFYSDVPEDSKTLEDVVVRKALSKEDFKNKLNSCADRLSEYKERGEEITE